MQQIVYDALVRMFGKVKADALAEEIDGMNRTIQEQDLVRRQAAQPKPTPAVPPTPTPAPVKAAPAREIIRVTLAPGAGKRGMAVAASSTLQQISFKHTLAETKRAVQVPPTPTEEQGQPVLYHGLPARKKVVWDAATGKWDVQVIVDAAQIAADSLERMTGTDGVGRPFHTHRRQS